MFLSLLPLPCYSQLSREEPQGAAVFAEKALTAPLASQCHGEEEAAPIPATMVPTPLQLAATPSPAGHQLCGLATMDDLFRDAATPLSYCCLFGGW